VDEYSITVGILLYRYAHTHAFTALNYIFNRGKCTILIGEFNINMKENGNDYIPV
jgi:hypothetical protein